MPLLRNLKRIEPPQIAHGASGHSLTRLPARTKRNVACVAAIAVYADPICAARGSHEALIAWVAALKIGSRNRGLPPSLIHRAVSEVERINSTNIAPFRFLFLFLFLLILLHLRRASRSPPKAVNRASDAGELRIACGIHRAELLRRRLNATLK